MISTAIELAGFACAIEAAYAWAGRGGAYACAAACLLFLGFVTEGRAITRPAWLPRPSWTAKLRRTPKDG